MQGLRKYALGASLAGIWRSGPYGYGMGRRGTFSCMVSTTRRCYAPPPPPSSFSVEEEEEARRAYGILGLPISTRSLPEVKKQYMSLAKIHHPDVVNAPSHDETNSSPSNTNTTTTTTSSSSSSSSSPASSSTASRSTCRMVEINNAYGTLSKFLKAGGTLPEHRGQTSRASPSFSPFGEGDFYVYTDPFSPHDGGPVTMGAEAWEDPHYVPFYEMMWEEMRGQAAAEPMHRDLQEHYAAAAAASQKYKKKTRLERSREDVGSSFSRRAASAASPREEKKNETSTSSSKEERLGGDGTSTSKAGKTAKGGYTPHSTWSKSDQAALHHMYEEGKSFDFIANALKKSVEEVTDEFNSWKQYEHTSSKRVRGGGGRRRRGQWDGPGALYENSGEDGMKEDDNGTSFYRSPIGGGLHKNGRSVRHTRSGATVLRGPGGRPMYILDDDEAIYGSLDDDDADEDDEMMDWVEVWEDDDEDGAGAYYCYDGSGHLKKDRGGGGGGVRGPSWSPSSASSAWDPIGFDDIPLYDRVGSQAGPRASPTSSRSSRGREAEEEDDYEDVLLSGANGPYAGRASTICHMGYVHSDGRGSYGGGWRRKKGHRGGRGGGGGSHGGGGSFKRRGNDTSCMPSYRGPHATEGRMGGGGVFSTSPGGSRRPHRRNGAWKK